MNVARRVQQLALRTLPHAICAITSYVSCSARCLEWRSAFSTSTSSNANPVTSLGAPALAFLAGYSVETIFRMLDGLAEQFSSTRK